MKLLKAFVLAGTCFMVCSSPAATGGMGMPAMTPIGVCPAVLAIPEPFVKTNVLKALLGETI